VKRCGAGARHQRRLYQLGVVFGALCSGVIVAQDRPTKTPPRAPAVERALQGFAALPAMTSGTLGFYLAPLEKPAQPLAAMQAQKSFIPASTLKTLTTGVALEKLGADHRFQTQLLAHEGAGQTNLIIRGGGDPSLARDGWEELFGKWTDALRAAGAREITGRVIADESAWETQEFPDGWPWRDLGNYFAPPLSPLAFHDNEFRLVFGVSGRPGERAPFLYADPWPAGLHFVDEMRLGPAAAGDNGYVYGGRRPDVYYLRGTLPAGEGEFFIRRALPDPALFCAQKFTEWLMRHEIPVHQPAETTRRLNHQLPLDFTKPAGKLISTHESAPLGELTIRINHLSLNLD